MSYINLLGSVSPEDNQMPKLSAEDLNELQQLDQAARSFVTAASALGQARKIVL